jgi:hypothetical protein
MTKRSFYGLCSIVLEEDIMKICSWRYLIVKSLNNCNEIFFNQLYGNVVSIGCFKDSACKMLDHLGDDLRILHWPSNRCN